MKFVLIFGAFFMANALTLSEWRAEVAEKTKKNWLVVVGLDWLSEGENSAGSAADQKVRLPSPAPAKLGVITRNKNQASITFSDVKDVTVDGKSVVAKKPYALSTDKSGKPTIVEIKTVQFYIIDRPNGLGVRVKDQNSATLRDFKGLQWWDEKKEFKVTGEWKAFAGPRTLRVPDIQGNTNDEVITGSVHFQINGQKFELFPTREGDKLFFVFKDLTSGKESYGTGRFLTAEVEKDNKVVVDFNKAYNPPCAHIHFATCPMPPPENKMNIAIPAGEKAPLKKH